MLLYDNSDKKYLNNRLTILRHITYGRKEIRRSVKVPGTNLKGKHVGLNNIQSGMQVIFSLSRYSRSFSMHVSAPPSDVRLRLFLPARPGLRQ
jgi:hypothetical protein